MAKRKSLSDVRQAIRHQIPAIQNELKSDISYVMVFARGRCMSLEIFCISMGFELLSNELQAMREQSYADEEQRLKGGI